MMVVFSKVVLAVAWITLQKCGQSQGIHEVSKFSVGWNVFFFFVCFFSANEHCLCRQTPDTWRHPGEVQHNKFNSDLFFRNHIYFQMNIFVVSFPLHPLSPLSLASCFGTHLSPSTAANCCQSPFFVCGCFFVILVCLCQDQDLHDLAAHAL